MKTLSELKLSHHVVSVDIETTGTEINSKIVSIGAVVKNLDTGGEVDVFYIRCYWENDQQARTESASTMRWINKLEPDAKREFFDDEKRYPLPIALIKFNEFLQKNFHPNEKIMLFGNGCEFDNAILSHAMDQYRIKPLWHYAGNQSLRTAVWFGRYLLGIDPKYSDVPDTFIAHHALHDARHEANYLYEIVTKLKSAIGDLRGELPNANDQSN